MVKKTAPKSTKKEYSRSIAPVDPVKHYIWEVNQYPLLEKEEEEELVRRYNENKDVEAAKKAINVTLTFSC